MNSLTKSPSPALALAVLALLFPIVAAQAGAATPAGASRSSAAAQDVGPIGWRSYRRLDLLPYLRHGVNTFQASSYDRKGRNDDGNNGTYSCLHRVAAGCVLAEHHGPGELDAVWSAMQVPYGAAGRVMIELDGRTVLNETIPELTSGTRQSPFAFPLALADNESWGGSSLQAPLPFRYSMRVITQFNPHYFHVVYRTFPSSTPVQATPRRDFSPRDVVSELRRAGTRDPKPSMGAVRHRIASFHLNPGQRATVGQISGSGAITELRLRFLRYASSAADPQASAVSAYERVRLLISFDGRTTVDAPVGEFFGSGLGPAKVRALMFAMNGTPYGWARSWWPMPFARSATVELINDSPTRISAGQLGIMWARNPARRGRLGAGGHDGYFHAYGHSGETRPGHDWTFLEAEGAGTFVGVTLTMRGASPPVYMEGNERATVDGARTPQIKGTGTEDFFDGGWYFWNNLFSLPLSGFTAHAVLGDPSCGRPTCKSAYRLMIADAVPFARSIVYGIQHGPWNDAQAIYSSTAYWYQAATPSGHG